MPHGLKSQNQVKTLLHADFGDRLVSYDFALRVQQLLRSTVSVQQGPDILLQLQHPPLYTVGKRGQPQDFRISEETLQKNGIDVYRVPRGGETTFHGPGQLIMYPVISLRRLRRGARAYVEGLEDTIIHTLEKYGIQGKGRQPAGRTGVWVEDRKIAALGVQISAGVATHGLALNVSTDLDHFKHIVPCGLPDSDITSMENELKKNISLAEVTRELRDHFVEIFGYDSLERVSPDILTGGL